MFAAEYTLDPAAAFLFGLHHGSIHIPLLFAVRYFIYGLRFIPPYRDGKIPRRLVWLMVMAAFLLNLFHIILLVWADYPREEYYPRMEELTKQVHAEAGIADIKFSSFTYAVRLKIATTFI
jgi:hypothetical protein